MIGEKTLELVAVLQNEEVVAWEALEAYFLKHKIVPPYAEGSSTLPARRVIRELLHLAAKQLPKAINPKVRASLAVPPAKAAAYMKQDIARARKKSGAGSYSENTDRPANRMPEPKPKHRTVWNRQWSRPKDAAE